MKIETFDFIVTLLFIFVAYSIFLIALLGYFFSKKYGNKTEMKTKPMPEIRNEIGKDLPRTGRDENPLFTYSSYSYAPAVGEEKEKSKPKLKTEAKKK